jgi:DNA-binding response OmpR family regulator
MVSLPISLADEEKDINAKPLEPRIDSSAWSYQDIDSSKQAQTQQTGLPLLMIVEDNADMRLFIQSEFMDSYRIIEVANGARGLEMAFVEIPDVIISDVMMPVMDGVEFCRHLKSDERTSHIPIVMLTAKSSDENALLGLESGADDYIVKPFNASILRLKIRNIIQSRKRYQSRFIQEPAASIKEIAPTALDEKFLKKAYQVVERNIENADLDANDFAIAVGMSRAQVYRKITAITGQSVKEFIRIIRLKKAAELLMTQDDNITEIAFKVGFNSAAYFTKSFTDYYGVSPTKYVAQQREG